MSRPATTRERLQPRLPGGHSPRRTILAVHVMTILVSSSIIARAEKPITDEDREHWSFRPLLQPKVPSVTHPAARAGAIDCFIQRRIEQAGLQPMPQADPALFIRRVTFDLTGLPPAAIDVATFMRNDAPDAAARLVDRLLASLAWGERQAQHWLDLARFAETDGFEFDHVRPNAWRYRDWMIDALNADMPYDRFVKLQLAGDELHPDDPSAAVATGFLLCGPDMPDINLQEERRHGFLNDMTATVSSVFLGLQMGCAQCHDHKFDPVSQQDFYRLRAFFENADIFREQPIATEWQPVDRRRWEGERAQSRQRVETAIAGLTNSVAQRLREEGNRSDLRLEGAKLRQRFTADERTRLGQLEEKLARIECMRLPEFQSGRVMKEHSAQAEPSYVCVRGDFRRRGAQVWPSFPRIVNTSQGTVPAPAVGATTSGRRALAEWMAHSDNRLATRVIVNRLWQHRFGVGIAPSESDFGIMGDVPTHPELLDWLATELPRRGWSIKALNRLLVLSSTYRRSGIAHADSEAKWRKSLTVDPDNQLLSRMTRRRLEGEAIRDAMLASSESLSQRRGGPGVRPPLPPEIVGTLLRNQWPVTKTEADHRRRSIYLFVRRNLRFPIFEVFDKPDLNASCARRTRSTIAPQSLMLLNSKFSLDAARRLAGFILRQTGPDANAQVILCYQRILSRQPSGNELQLATGFLEQASDNVRESRRARDAIAQPIEGPPQANPYASAALIDLCLAMFNLNEFVYID